MDRFIPLRKRHFWLWTTLVAVGMLMMHPGMGKAWAVPTEKGFPTPDIPMTTASGLGQKSGFGFPLLNKTFGLDMKFPGRPKQTIGTPTNLTSIPKEILPQCLTADYLHTPTQRTYSATACNFFAKLDPAKLFTDLTKLQYQGKTLDINRDIKKGPYPGHEWRAFFPKTQVIIHTQVFAKDKRSYEFSVWIPASRPIPSPEPETLKFFEAINLNTYP